MPSQDVFITAFALGMPTTAGSPALLDAKASTNSPIVQRLLDAGMIILGKTNMTVPLLSPLPHHVIPRRTDTCLRSRNSRE